MIYPGTDRCTRLLYEYQAVPEVTGTCTPGYLKRVLIYTKPEEYIYMYGVKNTTLLLLYVLTRQYNCCLV